MTTTEVSEVDKLLNGNLAFMEVVTAKMDAQMEECHEAIDDLCRLTRGQEPNEFVEYLNFDDDDIEMLTDAQKVRLAFIKDRFQDRHSEIGSLIKRIQEAFKGDEE